MAQEKAGQDPFAEYLGHFDGLIGDRRTGRTLGENFRGIIDAGSLVCRQIALIPKTCRWSRVALSG